MPTAFWNRTPPSKRPARHPRFMAATRAATGPDADSRGVLILHVWREIIAGMKYRLAMRRGSLFCAVLLIALHSLLCACATPGQNGINTPEGRIQDYPPVIEDT